MGAPGAPPGAPGAPAAPMGAHAPMSGPPTGQGAAGHAGPGIPAPLAPRGAPSSGPFSPAPSAQAPHAIPGPSASDEASTQALGAAPMEREPTSTTVPSPFEAIGPGAAAAMAAPAEADAVKAIGLTPTSDAARSGAPEASRDPRRCARCGGDAVLEGATLGIFGAGQLALQLPDGTRVLVTAGMCGHCGDVRLTAEGARHLFEAMFRHRG